MDYTQQGRMFQIKKAWRYVRLYGLQRTRIKVAGQYHMKKTYADLPAMRSPQRQGPHVGLIGCGNFAFSNIAYYLRKNYGNVIQGAMDIDVNKAASLFERYNLNYYTDDPKKIIKDPAVDLVYVASNHATHAEYAIEALDRGKAVHIEKPHVVRQDQLVRLCSAMERSSGQVNLGFNRPHSRLGRTIKQYLDSQTGPAMYNWFVAGHEIAPEHWYCKDEEGGRVFGNLCHWTDFVYQLVPQADRYPLTIVPTRSQKSDCDIAVTYIFGDGSIAAITFSAKGPRFEGVSESFSAQRGNVLITMSNFHHLTVEVVEKKYHIRQCHRDHGHEATIKRSYELARPSGQSSAGCSVAYVWEAGDLFLKTKQALETNERVRVEAFDPSCLS